MTQIVLLIMLLVGVPLAVGVWLVIGAVRSSRQLRDLNLRLAGLEAELRSLRSTPAPATVPRPAPASPAAPPVAQPKSAEPPPLVGHCRPPPPPAPPPLPVAATSAAKSSTVEPPVGPEERTPLSWPAVDWERFMGVKLFAWIGGFALFLALLFFLKHAFEHGLISPELQVAGEYLLAIGLLAGGLWIRNRDYAVLSQTLCATAVVALYAVTFAAHAYYRLLGVAPSFALMMLVTAVAFALAVRRDAVVVAVLGLLGGFLTPILISTGQDNPAGLFTYIGLLDAGLIAVAARKRWGYLVPLAAAGTVLMQVLWAAMFFAVGKIYIAMAVLLVFQGLFLAGHALYRRRNGDNDGVSAAALVTAFAPFAFGLWFLTFKGLGAQPVLLFGLVFLADAGVLALALQRRGLYPAHLAAGVGAFLLLAIWTVAHLSDALLNHALALYFVFALFHAVAPVVLRQSVFREAPGWWAHLFPLAALALVLLPILKLTGFGFLVWVFVLLVDLVVIGVALVSGSALAIIGALALTAAATGAFLLRAPATLSGLPEMLVVVGGFAVFFFLAGILAGRRLRREPASAGAASIAGAPATDAADPWAGLRLPMDARAQLPAFSAVLPFVLLMMMVVRLPLTDPSPVFGLGLLLAVMLLGVTRWLGADWLTAVTLGCVLALQLSWHNARFTPDAAVVSLGWYALFYAMLMMFPFLFHRRFQHRVIPWASSALAGPLHFYLVYSLFEQAFPNPWMGALPAAMAVPPVLGLAWMIRAWPADQPNRNTCLAWFGGSALFFITLIFPIQFEREWITIGWALEGLALVWLYHRVPHAGLRLVGVGLLAVSFARLALNPEVFGYYHRSEVPVFNWYLYAYGIVTGALFAAARLLAPPRQMIGPVNAPPILYGLGTALAFLLLNIQIADFFSDGPTIVFQFSENFARDMTYSIAWAMFAFVLLAIGIAKHLTAARYASLGLLTVTLLKLFFHDLAQLGQLYRVGAFVGVAIVLLLASFLYQRFFASERPSS
jgi:uncharacterized membrane protein